MSAIDAAREKIAAYLDTVEPMRDEEGNLNPGYTQEDYDNAQVEAEYRLMDTLIAVITEIDEKEAAS